MSIEQSNKDIKLAIGDGKLMVGGKERLGRGAGNKNFWNYQSVGIENQDLKKSLNVSREEQNFEDHTQKRSNI